jgi:WD40 repeat protein
MTNFYDAFISYGRADSKAFATQLHDRLATQNLNIWFDQNDIPLGVDFQHQIDHGITKAHNFIFIIAPHSVNSPYCHKEIELARQLNKRIVPILHVETIDRATWQRRNPEGNDTDWQAYQAKGLDNSFANMHPTIGKINWIYCREHQDDLDQSFQGLLAVLARHQDYVTEHTQLLDRAITWQRQQHQSHYLLGGGDRHQAETWLHRSFSPEQPPCIPTDLHCEYICESIKQANNQMTQVFLAYGEADEAVMTQVRRSLLRQGITVWTSHRDIQTGETYETAIERGIEATDNLVYLLSVASLESTHCQRQLAYGLSLYKRIIPLRLEAIDPSQLPTCLQSLQYIDLADNLHENDYLQDESQLLKTLAQDLSYHRLHKILLSAALAWERQKRNPSLLLRGGRLEQAQVWLRTGQQRIQSPPTELHQTFIDQSRQQPPPESLGVFLAFAAVDMGFAHRLNNALQGQGKLTWFEPEGFSQMVANHQEMERGIEQSENILVVLTPEFMAEPACLRQITYAQGLNKRFITVLLRPLTTDLPDALAPMPLIDLAGNLGNFPAQFNELIRLLDTDRNYVQAHTRWFQRALEWQQKDQTDDLLLRGNELAFAETWLAQADQDQKQPPPMAVQRDWIGASQGWRDRQQQAAEAQRQQELVRAHRMALGATIAGTLIAGFGILAGFQWHQANQQRIEARRQRNQANLSRVQTLVVFSQVDLELNLQFGALVRALQAWQILQDPDEDLGPELSQQRQQAEYKTINYLRDALVQVSEFNRIQGSLAQYSPDRKTLATVAEVGHTVLLWDLRGHAIGQLTGHGDQINSLDFSPDGQYLVTGAGDGLVQLWDYQNQRVVKVLEPGDDVKSVNFAPDGQHIAAIVGDNTAWVWSLTGETLVKFDYDEDLNSVQFSPDGQYLATTSPNRTAQLWNLAGQQLAKFEGHQANVNQISFSPDGQRLATASADRTARLWNLADALPPSSFPETFPETSTSPPQIATLKASVVFQGHERNVNGVRFTPDGQYLVTVSDDATSRLWTLDGNALGPFNARSGLNFLSFSPDGRYIALSREDKEVSLLALAYQNWFKFWGHINDVNGVAVSADSQWVATASSDRTVRLWDRQGRQQRVFEGFNNRVNDVVFSPDGQWLAAAAADGVAQLWNLQDASLNRVLEGHEDSINGVAFSPNGQRLATASWDRTLRLWNLQGEQVNQFPAHSDDIYQVAFSPAGQYIATTSDDGLVYLWSGTGETLTQLQGHGGGVLDLALSPDGQWLVTGSIDNHAHLWQIQAEGPNQVVGVERVRLSGHEDDVRGVAFSPDGAWVATASADNTARLWALDGQEIARFRHQGQVNGVSFSPDGTVLMTASSDNVASEWELGNLEDREGIARDACVWLEDYLANSDREYKEICQDFGND